MSSVPSLIPLMPELSVKLPIKINYHQFNALIPNTHSNTFELKLDHYQQLTVQYEFTEISLFFRVTDLVFWFRKI